MNIKNIFRNTFVLIAAFLLLFGPGALRAQAAPAEVPIDLAAYPYGDPEYGWTVNANNRTILIFGATDAVGTQKFRYTILRSDFTGHSA
ncbi:MAG: hypothetical protein LBB57_07115, partial [Clostridiales Family XIII bacterium]|nr:hypothetical protein [Clostridiales Family XIII bacterium]